MSRPRPWPRPGHALGQLHHTLLGRASEISSIFFFTYKKKENGKLSPSVTLGTGKVVGRVLSVTGPTTWAGVHVWNTPITAGG